MSNVNHKRIALNTILLYIRMLITMGISLYSVRLLLEALGVIDFGIYNVVGGIVTVFSFLSISLSAATQRFYSFELGKENYEQLNKVFNMSIIIFIMVILLIVILAESLGLWFFKHKLTIPSERLNAAFWVYQFSIATFALTLISVPYNGLVIAREKMGFFAVISIAESILKLFIAILLLNSSKDRLQLYAFLLLFLTLVKVVTYIFYCRFNFKESKTKMYWDEDIFKELITFSGWSLFGSLVGIFRNQGISIMINLFFNPALNTTQAIAFRLSTTLRTFSNNFFTAARPQIFKLYSRGHYNEFENLIISSSKFSFYLMMLLSFPLIFEIEFVLNLWLKIVPEYTTVFSRLAIITALVEIINTPVVTAIQATGNIKLYQIVIGVIQLLLIPLVYLFYYLGYPAHASYFIMLGLTVINFIPRLIIYQKVTALSALTYIRKLLQNISLVCIICLFAHLIVIKLIPDGFNRFILSFSISFLFSPLIIYIIGIDSIERSYLKHHISKRLKVK